MNILFGPVPSRRLGRSLGIDLVPFKTCTYDCIYCQLGRTTQKTDERREWMDVGDIEGELREKIKLDPDYITLGGSGEPTLHSGIGELIDLIQGITDIPVAVLTNGSLLWREDVRRDLMRADLVIPSLDAGDQDVFEHINRPVTSISYQKMVQGIASFTDMFSGECWLEVFIIEGMNSTIEAAKKIADAARDIQPTKVQLNTVSRPPAELSAIRASMGHLQDIAHLFPPPTEIIADHSSAHDTGEHTAAEESIVELLKRRPCTIDDVSRGLEIHRNEAIKHINTLTKRGVISSMRRDDTVYYRFDYDR